MTKYFTKIKDCLTNKNNYHYKTHVFVIVQSYIFIVSLITLISFIIFNKTISQMCFWLALVITSPFFIKYSVKIKDIDKLTAFIDKVLAIYVILFIPFGLIIVGNITSPSSIYITVIIGLVGALASKTARKVLVSITIFYCLLFIYFEYRFPHLFDRYKHAYIQDLADWTLVYFIIIIFIYRLITTTRNIIEKNEETILKQKDRLYIMSITDYLTGTYNKKYLNDELKNIAYNIQNTDTPYILISIDIDHFKIYNDTYGHLEGDVCLKKISQIFIDSVKNYDGAAYRFGGEEFIICLKAKDFNDGVSVVKYIQDKIKEKPIVNIKSPIKPYVTVSMGIVAYGKNYFDCDINPLLHSLDLALYRAKENGKDQCWAYDGKKFWKVE